MPTTALISAGLGAAGSIGGALIGSSASKTASQQQVAEQQQALAQQQALFNQGLGQQSNYVTQATNALSPYANAGKSVLPTLQGLITPGANQNALLAQTPGFQFASQYGTMAATNALAAKTGASAGPLAAAISQFNNGLAQNTWQSTVNALQGYAGLGANAAGTSANIFGSAGNADVGAGITAGNSQAGTLTNTGNALASGTLGSAAALSGGVTGAAGAGSNALLYSQLFGNGNNGLYANLKAGDSIPGALGPTSVGGGQVYGGLVA